MLKQKILYISKEFNWKNGGNKSASDVLYSLLNIGCQVYVVTHSPKANLDKDLFTKEIIAKLQWFRIPRKLSFNEIKNFYTFMRWLVYSINDILIHSKHINTLKPDLIIVNSLSGDDLMQKYVSNIESKKIIILRASVDSFKSPDIKYNADEVVSILKQYDHIVFVSKNVQDKWLKFDELKGVSNSYIPNCIEEEKISNVKSKPKTYYKKHLKFPSEEFSIIIISSVQYRKGQDILIQQIPKIIELIPNVRFYFIGKKIRHFYRSLKKEIRKLGISHAVKFFGERKNVYEYFAAGDLFVFPTRAEAMPRVILEAMAARIPIVSSNVDGIPELIDDGKEGLLFPLEDENQIHKLVQRIYQEKDLSRTMINNAGKKYWEHFSRRIHMQNYKNLVNSFLID
jgi:glycosyltransferase involved in cell wall biosynthesis